MAVRTSLRTITQDYSPLVTGVSIRDGAFGRVTGHSYKAASRFLTYTRMGRGSRSRRYISADLESLLRGITQP
jgi:hypothetical protein